MIATTARQSGQLFVVATPIGNLNDISRRAITTLESVDVILAEDTRHSRQLLNTLGIQTPLQSLHAHNEAQKTELILKELEAGRSFALISDAGTPLISDPGFILIREARRRGIVMVPIPGPSALITALSVAGVPCDKFFFEGFLPAKKMARCQSLEAIKQCPFTVVVYESTHRLLDTLEDIMEVWGAEYALVVAKELTKRFEQILHAPVAEIKAWFLAETSRSNGEFVIIFPAVEVDKRLSEGEGTPEDRKLLGVLLAELPLKHAVKIAAQLTSTSKNALYVMALQLQQMNS